MQQKNQALEAWFEVRNDHKLGNYRSSTGFAGGGVGAPLLTVGVPVLTLGVPVLTVGVPAGTGLNVTSSFFLAHPAAKKKSTANNNGKIASLRSIGFSP